MLLLGIRAWPGGRGANNTLSEVNMGTAWAGLTERDIINEGNRKSETDSDEEHECKKIGGGGGMVM